MKAIRSSDSAEIRRVMELLGRYGYGFLAYHSNVFRDEDDWIIVILSPYTAALKVIDIPRYDVEVSDYSIYSYGTK